MRQRRKSQIWHDASKVSIKGHGDPGGYWRSPLITWDLPGASPRRRADKKLRHKILQAKLGLETNYEALLDFYSVVLPCRRNGLLH